MGGGVHPPWDATETTFHSSEKWKFLTIDAWDDFDKERRTKSEMKKNRKGGCTPPINPSPIK